MSDVPVPVDEMTEFVIEQLLGTKDGARAIPYRMALNWAERPALEVVLALSLAAQAVEAALGSARDREVAQEAWQIAALVAVDVHMVQVSGGPALVLARDLLGHWRKVDGFFLPAGAPPAAGQ